MADNRSNIWVNIFLVISIIALLFDLILGVSMIIGDDVSYVVTMVFLFTILITLAGSVGVIFKVVIIL